MLEEPNLVYQQLLSFVEEKWKLKIVSLELLRQGVNRVYRVFTKSEQPLIIRIAHENIRPFSQIVAEIDWLQYLALQNYPTRLPISTKQDEFVLSFTGEQGQFNIVCFNEVPGEVFTKKNPFGSPEGWQAIGELMARLHILTDQYIPQINPLRYQWYEEPIMTNILTADNNRLGSDMVDTINKHIETLKEWPIEQHYGLIHYDFKGDNLITQPNKLFIIDFDSSCYHWRIADLLMPIYYYFLFPRFNKGTTARPNQLLRVTENLLAGYQKLTPIPKVEVQHLLELIKQLDILLLCGLVTLSPNLFIRDRVMVPMEASADILRNRILDKKTDRELKLEEMLCTCLVG